VIRVEAVIIRVVHRREIPDLGVIANLDGTSCNNCGALIDENPLTDLEPRMWRGADLAAGDPATYHEPPAYLHFPITVQYRQTTLACHEGRLDSLDAEPGAAGSRFDIENHFSLHGDSLALTKSVLGNPGSGFSSTH
jgi:hypothetical protein